jgi:hypothetical protein
VPNVVIRRNIEGAARIMTDESQSYAAAGKMSRLHETVNHSADESVRCIIHVNFAESFFSS